MVDIQAVEPAPSPDDLPIFAKAQAVLVQLRKSKHDKAAVLVDKIERARDVARIKGPRRDHWLQELASRVHAGERVLGNKTDATDYHNNGPAPRANLLRHLNS